jgi:hypothetical protein
VGLGVMCGGGGKRRRSWFTFKHTSQL